MCAQSESKYLIFLESVSTNREAGDGTIDGIGEYLLDKDFTRGWMLCYKTC